jgi:hypothetical protein
MMWRRPRVSFHGTGGPYPIQSKRGGGTGGDAEPKLTSHLSHVRHTSHDMANNEDIQMSKKEEVINHPSSVSVVSVYLRVGDSPFFLACRYGHY